MNDPIAIAESAILPDSVNGVPAADAPLPPAAVPSAASQKAPLAQASAIAKADPDAPHAVSDSNLATFAQMRLKIGDPLHLEPSHKVVGGRALVNLLGWLAGSSVMVSTPKNSLGRVSLQEGEMVVLRYFNGSSAFAFRAAVLKVAHQPFPYLHLSFPDKISGVSIRNSPRCRLNLPVRISGDSEFLSEGRILNVSTTGALVESAIPLGEGKTQIKLAFSFELHGVPVSLELEAGVRTAKPVKSENAADPVQYGVAFRHLQPNDRLILGSLVWYTMYEHPRSTI